MKSAATINDVKKAITRLRIFEGQLGYPANRAGLLMTARAFSAIVHFRPPSEIVPLPNSILNDWDDDSEWLCAHMLERYDRFQSMQVFRENYRRFLPPRVAREDSDL